MENITVSLNILGKVFKLKIAPEKEEYLRASVKKINEIGENLRTNFNGLEPFDYLAMATMQFVTQIKTENKNEDVEEISEQLKRLSELIEK
jgi:cell division protein ZapA (FtsZ GTPase activity inhibitor)